MAQNWAQVPPGTQRTQDALTRTGLRWNDARELVKEFGLPNATRKFTPMQASIMRDYIYADWAAGEGFGITVSLAVELRGLISAHRLNWLTDDQQIWQIWQNYINRLDTLAA